MKKLLAIAALSASALGLASAPAAHANPGVTDGEVYNSSASRGSVIVVKNWLWPNNSWVTLKSVAASNRLYVAPGRTAYSYGVQDADGIGARPECTTRVTYFNKLFGDTWTVNLQGDRAYKMSGNLRATTYVNGTYCRG